MHDAGASRTMGQPQLRPSAYEPDVFSATSGRSIKPTVTAHDDAAQIPILSVNGITASNLQDIHIVDICFIPDTNGCIFDWVSEIVQMHQANLTCKQTLCLIRAWAHIQYIPPSVRSTIAEIITRGLDRNWSFSIHTYRLSDFGICLDGSRCWFELFPLQHSCDFTRTKISPMHALDEFGFHCHVDERLNTPMHNCSIMIPNPTQRQPSSATQSARIVGSIGCNIQNTAAPASSLILDSAYPGLQPAPDHKNQVFGRRFGP